MSWKKRVYYSKKDSTLCKSPMIFTNSSFLSGVKTGHTNVAAFSQRFPKYKTSLSCTMPARAINEEKLEKFFFIPMSKRSLGTKPKVLFRQVQTRSLIKTNSNPSREENSKEFSPIYGKDFLEYCFFNQCFDKGRLKNFVLWFLKNYGQNKTVKLVEQLKNIGFEYASKAGISLGIDDLKIPPKKSELIFEAEKNTTNTIHQYVRGEITGVERFQRLIDTWHSTSESLKQEVINYFEATDILNPVYMMAFSGARGNISQVRQLVGMRGLMSDPQGQIIDFPIRSNFREGLTLTEYLISSYGARKGIVDTALRTANAGYLTRRLVDVAQHVVISHFDCGTHRGIFLKDMKEGNKTIYSLIQRVVGRILARDLIDTSVIPKDQGNQLPEVKTEKDIKKQNGLDLGEYPVIAKRNEEITMDLAFSIVKKFDKIFVRSPLTCETNQLICQLCYGWSLGQGSTLVSIGEAVGVVAAQSIGEPGTQLTMRTFHTGGVFSGDISDQIRAPFDAIVEYPTAIPGTLIRTPEGKIAFLTKGEGSFVVKKMDNSSSETMNKYKIPAFTLLYKRHKQSVYEKEVMVQISTISRKSNATDAAELTIPSEYEGQFFSKSLDFREKLVGDAKLIESTLSQLRSQKNQHSRKKLSEISPLNQNETSSNPFNINYIDKLYEAWNWGYAWILSGKIYQLNLRGETCFPKFGDLVNTQSTMNQTQWNVYFNKGPAKMYFPFREPKIGPRSHGKKLSYGQLFNVAQNSSSEKNPPANVTIAQPFFFLDLLKIRFQKYGYILTSRNQSYSFENKFFNDKPIGNDLLFRMYEIHPRISDTIEKRKNLTTLQKKQKERGNQTLLHWFPFSSQTSTGGFILFEKLFQNNYNISSKTKHRMEKNPKLKQKTSNTLPKPSLLASTQPAKAPQKNRISPLAPPSRENFPSGKFSSVPKGSTRQASLVASGPAAVRAAATNNSKFYEEKISLGGVASQHPNTQQLTKKQSFSSSLKADFIKKLKMELNAEKMKKFSSMKGYSFFKFYKFKGITREQTKLKPLNTVISKCGKFGMHWKNTYKLCLQSRFDNLYNSNSANSSLRSGSSLSQKQTTKQKISRGLLGYGEKPRKNKTEGFVSTRKFSLVNSKFSSHDDLNLLFNKRILWIPNQFFKLSQQKRNITHEHFSPLSFSYDSSGKKMGNFPEGKFSSPSEFASNSKTFIKNEYNPKNEPIDIQLRPKEVELFFPKPPLFFQKNRQGHLKPFAYFLPFPSLLTAFNSYKDSNLEFDLNIRKNNLKTNNNVFPFTPFKYYKASVMNQSFGLHQKWSYCSKQSNLSNLSTTQQDNLLLTYNPQSRRHIEKSRNFPKEIFFSSRNFSPRTSNNIIFNSKFGPSFFHFVTFSNLVTIMEKKNIQTWLTPFKKVAAARTAAGPLATRLACRVDPFGTEENFPEGKFSREGGASADYFSIYSTNTPKDINSSPSHLSENFRYYTVISNSIQKQFKKLNFFFHKEQLSLFLLSLDFKPSFHYISPHLNHKIQISIQKCKEERYKRIYNVKSNYKTNSKNNFFSNVAAARTAAGPLATRLACRVDPFGTEENFPEGKFSREGGASGEIKTNEKFSSKKSSPSSETFVKNFNHLSTLNNSSSNYSTNLVLKKGWIYFMNNPSKMMSYHKTIIYPGQVNDLNLNASRPLYLECHTVKDVFDFKRLSLSSNNVKDPSYSLVQTANAPSSSEEKSKDFSSSGLQGKNGVNSPRFKNKECIKNTNSRYIFSTELSNKQLNKQKINNTKNLSEEFFSFNFEDFKTLYKSEFKQQKQKHKLLLSYLNQLESLEKMCFSKDDTNGGEISFGNLSLGKNSKEFFPTIVLLIQPVEEYNRMNPKELKTYVNECTLKHDSHYKISKFCFNKDKRFVKAQTRWRNFCLVSPFFSSLFYKKFFETHEYNKQKTASKELSKFPTSDITIYPMSLDNNFAMETPLGNEKIQTPYYRSLNKYKQPINFSPFFISFHRPMGSDFLFKDQNFYLSYEPFSRFDSRVIPFLSSHLSYFLNFYLTLNMNQNLTKRKILSSNLLKSSFEDITQSFHTDFISRFFESPCFCFQNIFHFKNPILHFENLERDLFRSPQFSPTKGFPKKNKPISTSKLFSRLPSSNTRKSSTLFSYSQRNEMFLGVKPLAKTNVFSPFTGEVVSLNLNKGCMILTSSNLISYYLAYKDDATHLNHNHNVQTSHSYGGVEKTYLTAGQTPSRNLNPLRSNYPVNNILVKFLNMTDIKLDFDLASKLNVIPNNNDTNLTDSSSNNESLQNSYKKEGVMSNISSKLIRVSNLVAGQPKDLNLKVRLGDFCVYGDPITNKTAIQTSGQLIHYNNRKITLRRSQPIFISPKGILHKFDNDFIDPKTPVITLSYQKLKTGDIIQGIPKVEQFFEARTTKRGRFFRDSLPYLLKSLFKRYSSKLPLDLAVRQSFYKIQQILVDGVHRVYKAQGVTIADKHLEVIVKQMTSKVRVIDGAQTGFFAGEVLDLFFVEKINSFLMKKITYEPLVLGITKASLEVDSFLSAASFQQTTRVLSKAAIFRKKDFLKGLKENVILGNLIPAGTGFLVYIDL